LSVSKAVGYGALGTVLDALSPGGGLDPLSYAFFVILLFIVVSEKIPAWAKVILVLALAFCMFLSPLEAVPGVDGLDSGLVMATAGALSGSGVASYFRYR